MDPSQAALIAQSMLQIATGIENQCAGLNPATQAALKHQASDLRLLAQRLSPPPPAAGAASQARPSLTSK